jgi:hypothetical protein
MTQLLRNNAKEMDPQTGWSQAGPLICQQTSPTVSMQVCFPKADIYTVQFEVSRQLSASGQTGQITFADLEWIVNGTTVRRTVSVVSGSTISGVGSSLNVKVYDASPPGSEVGVAGERYTVTINVSPGLRPAQSQQPYYAIPNPDSLSTFWGKNVFVPSVGPSTLQVFFPQLGDVFYRNPPTSTGQPKPIGATSVHVVVGSLDGSPIANQEAQVQVDNLGLIYDPRDSPQWQPIPPGAYAATLINNSTGHVYRYSVKLGIDG